MSPSQADLLETTAKWVTVTPGLPVTPCPHCHFIFCHSMIVCYNYLLFACLFSPSRTKGRRGQNYLFANITAKQSWEKIGPGICGALNTYLGMCLVHEQMQWFKDFPLVSENSTDCFQKFHRQIIYLYIYIYINMCVYIWIYMVWIYVCVCKKIIRERERRDRKRQREMLSTSLLHSKIVSKLQQPNRGQIKARSQGLSESPISVSGTLLICLVSSMVHACRPRLEPEELE